MVFTVAVLTGTDRLLKGNAILVRDINLSFPYRIGLVLILLREPRQPQNLLCRTRNSLMTLRSLTVVHLHFLL